MGAKEEFHLKYRKNGFKINMKLIFLKIYLLLWFWHTSDSAELLNWNAEASTHGDNISVKRIWELGNVFSSYCVFYKWTMVAQAAPDCWGYLYFGYVISKVAGEL